MPSDAARKVMELLNEACDQAGSRNKLAGFLDISSQALDCFRRSGEASLTCALKLEKMTGVSWREYAPRAANKVDGIGHSPEGGCDHE